MYMTKQGKTYVPCVDAQEMKSILLLDFMFTFVYILHFDIDKKQCYMVGQVYFTNTWLLVLQSKYMLVQ